MDSLTQEFGPPTYDTPQGFVAAHLMALSDVFDRRETTIRIVWDAFEASLLRDLTPGWEDTVADSFEETAKVLMQMAGKVRGMG